MLDQSLHSEPLLPRPGALETSVERVVFGRKAKLPEGSKATNGWSLRAFAWLLAILLAIAAWTILSRYLPLPRVQAMVAYLGGAALLWWLSRMAVGRLRKRTDQGGVLDKVEEEAGRLRVAGKGGEPDKLRAMGEVRDEPFEPVVLLAPKVIDMPWQATTIMVLSGLGFCGLMILLRKTTLPYMSAGWIPFMAGCGLGVGAQILLWPTYARVTPGRLDIMRYRLWSRRPTTVTIRLRNAQVLADFDKSTLFIKPAAPGARWTSLSLRGVWSPVELVHAVLRGAMSSAPTPPLPEDELVG